MVLEIDKAQTEMKIHQWPIRTPCTKNPEGKKEMGKVSR